MASPRCFWNTWAADHALRNIGFTFKLMLWIFNCFLIYKTECLKEENRKRNFFFFSQVLGSWKWKPWLSSSLPLLEIFKLYLQFKALVSWLFAVVLFCSHYLFSQVTGDDKLFFLNGEQKVGEWLFKKICSLFLNTVMLHSCSYVCVCVCPWKRNEVESENECEVQGRKRIMVRIVYGAVTTCLEPWLCYFSSKSSEKIIWFILVSVSFHSTTSSCKIQLHFVLIYIPLISIL